MLGGDSQISDLKFLLCFLWSPRVGKCFCLFYVLVASFRKEKPLPLRGMGQYAGLRACPLLASCKQHRTNGLGVKSLAFESCVTWTVAHSYLPRWGFEHTPVAHFSKIEKA